MGINLVGQNFAFIGFKSEKHCHTRKGAVSVEVDGERVTASTTLIETTENKTETDLVRKFEGKARAALLRHCYAGPNGIHLVSDALKPALQETLVDLQRQATDINASLTVCKIGVDCLVVPIDLQITPECATAIRRKIQDDLCNLQTRITTHPSGDDKALGSLRADSYKARTLVSLTSGVNADAVTAALSEIKDALSALRRGETVSDMPALDAAVALFATPDVDNLPTFDEDSLAA